MNFPFASLSPNVSAALMGVAIIAAGITGFMIIRWIKNLLRHRLPQPFLGGGSNVEWAEQKRAEIAAGGFAYDPDLIDDPVRSDFEATDSDLEIDSRGVSIGENGNHSEKDLPEGPNGINKDDLLHSWLSDSGHTDDEWAEKLLGDREPTQGT